MTVVFHSARDITKKRGLAKAIASAARVNPGSRVSSYFSTGSNAYVSEDRHTTFANIYPPGKPSFNSDVHIKETRQSLLVATPPGVEAHLTGRDPLYEASSGGNSGGPSVLTEALIGGLGAMVILPVPVIRSIGIGGMLIPAVSVLTSITLLPALLAMLGHRINRLRVMPKRIVERQDPTTGFWHRWAVIVTRRPVPVAALGILIVALLLIPGVQLHAAESQLKDFPGKGDAIVGRTVLNRAGFSPGVMKPYVVLVEHSGPNATRKVVGALERTPGLAAAVAPPQWVRGGDALVEAFPTADSASNSSSKTISRIQHDVLPAVHATATLGGVSPEDRDFVHAVYGKFPYVLAFVILLTFVLLMRAFRSILLPLKAVVLNLVSLGAAYGIIVFIFQWGHGSNAIWGVPATNAIISWIPLMIFAFLYGLSMDYEVFMLTRMREEYDEAGDTGTAVELGLARTGKLVTSAALVLLFAFSVLSSSPGVDIKQFGIGLAAGIIFDATVIRVLLVPALMRLLGRWNWWLPRPAARVLFVRPHKPARESA